MPCIIREVLRAPDAPLPVENLMEAALSYHNVSHYDAAPKTYGAAESMDGRKITIDRNILK